MNSQRKIQALLLAMICLVCKPVYSQHAGLVPPLHTEGHQILDASENPVRLTSVNWYGFDQKEYVAGGLDHAPLATIVEQIRQIGVNSVRLPWANETLERNPLVPDYAVAANPQFKGKHAMEVMDAVIAALEHAHVMVILDNHVSRADWCCSESDGNGLWYNHEYPEANWLADWQTIAKRYRNQKWVVGADLRNELRNGAAWGGTDPKLDWHAAAERGGRAVLAANPRLLVIVEGPEYSTNFAGFDKLPVNLPVPYRLVYSPHAYYAAEQTPSSFEELKEVYEARATFLLHTEPGVPLWVGEFGTCQTLDCGAEADWFRQFVRLLKENPQISWSYWPLNGTQSTGVSRKYDAIESFGLLSADYKHIAAPKIVELLRTIEGQPPR
ncbi:glycoside hydrolase family 5 protein [Alloacidobacterium sp.]|uniref:glycoside hydrolase family 5 protein n=1 Tax=Alloacidobacterium sp. TaxID=2951999 RepID=UPI002D550435|nr:cellulase family glycosylhydrolase [Alloacidobacterium sp.]HYK36761.1 cellulase family glycosylhydrolase [Alloacidobacterium sp.]